jgi:predicted component of type VI protein secretion system
MMTSPLTYPSGLQQEQPQLYESLTKHLNHDEQSVIQAAVNQADAIEHQAAQAAQLETAALAIQSASTPANMNGEPAMTTALSGGGQLQ